LYFHRYILKKLNDLNNKYKKIITCKHKNAIINIIGIDAVEIIHGIITPKSYKIINDMMHIIISFFMLIAL